VKNERDAFDRFTDSDRAGWNKLVLPRRLKIIHDIYGNVPRDELRKMAARILELEWIKPMTIPLPDLAVIIAGCRQKIAQIDPSQPVRLDPANVVRLLNSYRELNRNHNISFVGGHTFNIGTGDQARCISIQELPKLAIMAEHLAALQPYRKALDGISVHMGFDSRTSGSGSDFFENLPSKSWKNDVGTAVANAFVSATLAVLPDPADQAAMDKFVSDPEWSGIEDGRKLNRPTDWQESAVLRTGGMVAAASAGRVNLIRAIEHAGFGANLVNVIGQSGACAGGENVIYYGAPGTGKSHLVNSIVRETDHVRTVFHPDLQNSDFFGCLKPEMNGKDVTYGFSPGPFMQALAVATDNPLLPVSLVIEELNRAAAAAVFGDLFLLLDRDGTGAGEYDVDFPSAESRKWFCERTGHSVDKIRIPSNLHIYATMNSADQGVFPLDTAFRRRWRQEYLKLDFSSGPTGNVGYRDRLGGLHQIPLLSFIKTLNDYLLEQEELAIAEDRLMGQWFVKENEIEGTSIPEKILLYLWDDLLRHDGRPAVFATDRIRTYGQLVTAIENEQSIFSDTLLSRLNLVTQPAPLLDQDASDDDDET
jgi:hypothetical protein